MEDMQKQVDTAFAKLDRMKVGIREQFKAQEAMFMREDEGMEFSVEKMEARKELMEKIVHFRTVSRLMVKKRDRY